MSEMNPYRAPESRAAVSAPPAGEFIAGGRAVDAGRGWEWIACGFALFKKQPGMWILLFIVFAVCSILISLIPFIGAVANMLLYPVFGAGFMLGCRALESEEELEIGHLFAGFKQNTSDLIIVGLLTLVAVIVIFIPALLIVGGAGFFAVMKGGYHDFAAMGLSVVLAALVVLGLGILVYMAVWFAPSLVVFHGLKPVEAMKASFFACLKNIVPFLVYGIIVLVLGVVAAIPLMLGFLVLGPVVLASVYTAYRDIFFAG